MDNSTKKLLLVIFVILLLIIIIWTLINREYFGQLHYYRNLEFGHCEQEESEEESEEPPTPPPSPPPTPPPLIHIPEVYFNTDNGSIAIYDFELDTWTLVGNVGFNLEDIAISPTGEMYGVTIGGGQLYQINPTTAAPTFIGNMTPNLGTNSLSFDENGILYGSTVGQLYTVSTVDATLTTVGLLPGSPLSAGDIAFSGDRCFLATTGQSLYNMDVSNLPTSLASSFSVGAFSPPSWTLGLAIYTLNGVSFLASGDWPSGIVRNVDPLTAVRTTITSSPYGAIFGATSMSWEPVI